MQRITHREYLIWMRYLEEQWEKPSRTDNYLMQIAAEVRRVLHSNPRRIKQSHFLLSFNGKEKKKPTEEEKQRLIAAAKARWTTFTKKAE